MNTNALRTAEIIAAGLNLTESTDPDYEIREWGSTNPPVSLTVGTGTDADVVSVWFMTMTAVDKVSLVYPTAGGPVQVVLHGDSWNYHIRQFFQVITNAAVIISETEQMLIEANARIDVQESALNRYKAAMDTLNASKGVIRDN